MQENKGFVFRSLILSFILSAGEISERYKNSSIRYNFSRSHVDVSLTSLKYKHRRQSWMHLWNCRYSSLFIVCPSTWLDHPQTRTNGQTCWDRITELVISYTWSSLMTALQTINLVRSDVAVSREGEETHAALYVDVLAFFQANEVLPCISAPYTHGPQDTLVPLTLTITVLQWIIEVIHGSQSVL